MRFDLFEDAEIVLSYYFSNGMVITTDPDYEYTHRIYVDVPVDVEVVAISYRLSDGVEHYMFPSSIEKFRTSSAGWLKVDHLSFVDLIHDHKIYTAYVMEDE